MAPSAPHRTTRIFSASSLYGAAALAAALDANLFRPTDRRILLVGNTAPIPESVPALTEQPAFARLRHHFDEVRSWNDVISPFHPAGWTVRGNDAPLWERHFRLLWRLGGDRVELAGETVDGGPLLALAQIFADAPVDAVADGLAVYGPTRTRLDPTVGTRVRRLLDPGLVPGLRPLLLREFGVPVEELPASALRAALAEPDAPTAPDALGATGPALLLGQYLAPSGLVGEEQEEEIHLRMVRGAVASGHRRLVFAPHPTAPRGWSPRLAAEAGRLGAELAEAEGPVAAESLFQTLRPALVVGCSSSALFTAATLYGLPVATVGADALLAGLDPYEAPQRIALTLADALLPRLEDPQAGSWRRPSAEEAAGLRDAVAFCMRPRLHPELRTAAEDYLARRLDARTWRYFTRRRLARLALPGAVPAQLAFLPRSPAVRRIARRARSLAQTARG
jgi:hypothetical protein